MALVSADKYLESVKQKILIAKQQSITTVAGSYYTQIDLLGYPNSKPLAGSNTANGIVPVKADAGYPKFADFVNKGYVGNITHNNSITGVTMIYDTLFEAGAYSFNSDVTLTAQPSYASRLPNTDYRNLELWIEFVTAFTGSPTFTIGYTNQDGVAGRQIVQASPVTGTVGRMFRIPLFDGDSGIQKIDRVRCTVATAGTFNVLVLRPIFMMPCFANGSASASIFETGCPEVFSNSAFRTIQQTFTTNSGIQNSYIELFDI